MRNLGIEGQQEPEVRQWLRPFCRGFWVRFGSNEVYRRITSRIKNGLSVPLKSNRLYVVSALSRHRPLSAYLNFANSESLGTPVRIAGTIVPSTKPLRATDYATVVIRLPEISNDLEVVRLL